MHRRTTGVSRRTVTKAAAGAGLAVLFGARTAAALGSRTVDVSVSSAALGRSAPVRLILPSGFGSQPTRTYPVLYLLHGAHDDYTSWTRETDIEAFTEGRDLIVAMPDAGPTGIPTAWSGGPDYETFQLKEVPALLARDYRASGVRVVAGSPPAATAPWRTRPGTRACSPRRPRTAGSSTPWRPVSPP